MTKTDDLKYEAPRGVRLNDATEALGDSCISGSSDVSCRNNGGVAHPACWTGNVAHGCLTGVGPTAGCNPGGHPGCMDGNEVITL